VIRTVIAVALTVAILGMSLPVIENGAASRSEKQLNTIAQQFESEAVSLVEEEELPPPGVDGARRVVEADFPSGSVFSPRTEVFRIERVPDENFSVVRYRAEGGTGGEFVIPVPIENVDGDPVDLGQPTGPQQYSLVLERQEDDRDQPLVVLQRGVDD